MRLSHRFIICVVFGAFMGGLVRGDAHSLPIDTQVGLTGTVKVGAGSQVEFSPAGPQEVSALRSMHIVGESGKFVHGKMDGTGDTYAAESMNPPDSALLPAFAPSAKSEANCPRIDVDQQRRAISAILGRDTLPGGGGGQPTTPANGGGEGNPAGNTPVEANTGAGASGGAQVPSNYGGASGEPLSQTIAATLPALQGAQNAANTARGQEFADSVQRQAESVQESRTHDREKVDHYYNGASLPVLRDSFRRAEDVLNRAEQAFDSGKIDPESPIAEPSEFKRFSNTVRNARDLAAAGGAAVDDELKKKETLGENSPFRGLLGSNSLGNALAKSAALSEIFGENPSPATELTERYVKLFGEDEKNRELTLANLELVEDTLFTMPDGKKITLHLPHNGYILGGGATGLDCSSLVSASLPADIRKTRLTTMDFSAMYVYLLNKKFLKPPLIAKKRLGVLQTMAEAFQPVDVYNGQLLRVGDLLVHRLPWETSGHVFVVKSYNPKTMTARVLEAAQSAGTVRERDFQVNAHPKYKYVRVGLFGLRLKPANNHACKYADGVQPAGRGLAAKGRVRK